MPRFSVKHILAKLANLNNQAATSVTLFNLDTPNSTQLNYLTRFSGWYIPLSSQEVRLSLYLNGKPYTSLSYGSHRSDVAAAYVEQEGAFESGFFGDLLLPNVIKPGEEIEIEIIDEGKEKTSLFKKKFNLTKLEETLDKKQKVFDIKRLLCCPNCGGNFKINELDGCCSNCGNTLYVRGATPHILQKNELPFLRLTEQQETHPYSQDVIDLLNEVGGGIVLDFGAGNTPEDYLRANVCYLDVQQYRHTDIVCSTLRLPFQDASFDAVISQAVFEHLPNPFFTASELHRIIKPGGLVYIDTAFMQPLHGDPNHYFNMTKRALQLIMSEFKEIQSGIKPYQYPSFGLIMQIEAVLPYVAQGTWKNRLEDFHQLLLKEGSDLDKVLGSKGREILAAGVFFKGRKLK